MPVVGNPYQDQNYGGEAIGSLLNLVLQGAGKLMQGNKDKAYRSAAAKALGVPEEELGYFQRKDLEDLVKEKYKSKISPKEWKPQTKEEAIEVAAAKKGASKSFEEGLKAKVSMGEPLNKEETNYYNRFLKKSMDPEIIYTDPSVIQDPVQAKPQSQGIGEVLKTILMQAHPVSGFINSISQNKPQLSQPGAVTSPVPQSVPTELAQPGAAAPVGDPIAKRIQEALAQGMDPKIIAAQLQEKGIDPATYGL